MFYAISYWVATVGIAEGAGDDANKKVLEGV